MKIVLFACVLCGLTGCDSFFTLSGTVVDQRTGAAVAGADGLLVLDKGIGEEDHTFTTEADGQFFLFMNEPEWAWATLTITKPGYGTWSTQFRGAAQDEVVVRLVPVRQSPP